MSILIKGMEMPEDKAIAVVIHPDGTAYSAEMFAGVCTKYLMDCEAVPARGRLGDLDDVINDVRHYICEGCGDYFGLDAKTESCDYCGAMQLIKAIERKPSIIPADREGEL